MPETSRAIDLTDIRRAVDREPRLVGVLQPKTLAGANGREPEAMVYAIRLPGFAAGAGFAERLGWTKGSLLHLHSGEHAPGDAERDQTDAVG